MYNAGKILIGLAVFLVVMAFPFLYNAGRASVPPELKLPATEKECVESKSFMRAKHMELVDQWRNSAVRQGERIYISANGKKYNMSLQNTCMNCHAEKTKFCDQCHNYVAVAPNCWSCHLEPKESK